MTKPKRAVDILQDSLVTGREGHSVTWRDERRTCSCGAVFEARIAAIDGVDVYSAEQCRKCWDETVRLERIAEAQVRLAEASTARAKTWVTECNCPPQLLAKTFDGFDKKRQPAAHKLMSSWEWKADKGVVLWSDGYGVGKTHLCGALVGKILQTEKAARLVRDFYVQEFRCPVYFTTEPQLMDRIRATFSGKPESNQEWNPRGSSGQATDEDIYRELSMVKVLVVDDVGKVRPRDPSFLQGVYYRIIDGRYTAGLPIVITTNLSLAELEAHVGGASADRLSEMCGRNFVKMSGESYRRP